MTPPSQSASSRGRQIGGLCLGVIAGSAVLGVAAGYLWAAVAPRPLLTMTGHGVASVINPETNAFIAADGLYCLICLAGGVITGALGYVFAVRITGPPAMAAVLAGALAAGLLAAWIGDQSGLAGYHHLLATLPAGALLRGRLILSAKTAITLWPLAACLTAGAVELTGAMRARRPAAVSAIRTDPRPDRTAP
jgi:hypothetical protein